MKSSISVTVLIGLMACGGLGSSSANILIETDRDEYAPLDPVIVTTVNRRQQPIFNDRCGGQIEGFEYLGEWNASYGAGRVCIGNEAADWREHSVQIDPEASVADTFHVNGQAYTGTWRAQLALRDSDGELLPLKDRVSKPFRVIGTWEP